MFRDRIHAGHLLGERLRAEGVEHPVVLGLPRGGVVVAAEVARLLEAPLDIIVVRKLGAPGNPELGLGAIAEEGVTVYNQTLISHLGVAAEALEQVADEEHRELERRSDLYRRGRKPVSLDGRSAVIVDDGLATGYTARAAIEAARCRGAESVVLAVPVAAPEIVDEMRALVDRLICLETPDFMFAVGAAYSDFGQTTDVEVQALLAGTEPGVEREVTVAAGEVLLPGMLGIPARAHGVVLFAHGSGSSRLSPRNRAVAGQLQQVGLATLLFDLLTPEEGADRAAVFDIPLLGERLAGATGWLRRECPDVAGLPIGYFGASTGAAAALWAAADEGEGIAAAVSRGGRPDLAMARLSQVSAPTLLIVGELDGIVIELNEAAQAAMAAPCSLEIVPGAGHLFEETGTLEQVGELAGAWFLRWMDSG
jgi:putative phosphoribosyl transferase